MILFGKEPKKNPIMKTDIKALKKRLNALGLNDGHLLMKQAAEKKMSPSDFLGLVWGLEPKTQHTLYIDEESCTLNFLAEDLYKQTPYGKRWYSCLATMFLEVESWRAILVEGKLHRLSKIAKLASYKKTLRELLSAWKRPLLQGNHIDEETRRERTMRNNFVIDAIGYLVKIIHYNILDLVENYALLETNLTRLKGLRKYCTSHDHRTLIVISARIIEVSTLASRDKEKNKKSAQKNNPRKK